MIGDLYSWLTNEHTSLSSEYAVRPIVSVLVLQNSFYKWEPFSLFYSRSRFYLYINVSNTYLIFNWNHFSPQTSVCTPCTATEFIIFIMTQHLIKQFVLKKTNHSLNVYAASMCFSTTKRLVINKVGNRVCVLHLNTIRIAL